MFDRDVLDRAETVLRTSRGRGLRLATAESCTGGLVAAALTALPGSSDVLERGYVTYSNAAKSDMLGVAAELFPRVGAVSREVAEAMAIGARDCAGVDLAVSITGIAGPGGGSPDKPVGLVWFACATSAGTVSLERRFGDLGRDEVRRRALIQALDLLIEGAGA